MYIFIVCLRWLKHLQSENNLPRTLESLAEKVVRVNMTLPPTLQARVEALRSALQSFSEVKILQESLAFNREPDSSIPTIARPLFRYIKLVSIDTEAFTKNTDQLTELGFVQIRYDQAFQLKGQVGEHGHQLLDLLRFLHFRIVEHAHLESYPEGSLDTSNPDGPRGPKGNLFGNTKWTTFQELRAILHRLINKPITGVDELEGCLEPVVLVGHDLGHDIAHAAKSGLQFDLASQPSVVAQVDTQILARKVGLRNPTIKSTVSYQISLKNLTQVLGFKHDQLHTACNDASRTLICAINMVLRKVHKNPENPRCTLQEVVKQLEVKSRNQISPLVRKRVAPSVEGESITNRTAMQMSFAKLAICLTLFTRRQI